MWTFLGVHDSVGDMVLEEQSYNAHRGKNVIRTAKCRKPGTVWRQEAITEHPPHLRIICFEVPFYELKPLLWPQPNAISSLYKMGRKLGWVDHTLARLLRMQKRNKHARERIHLRTSIFLFAQWPVVLHGLFSQARLPPIACLQRGINIPVHVPTIHCAVQFLFPHSKMPRFQGSVESQLYFKM